MFPAEPLTHTDLPRRLLAGLLSFAMLFAGGCEAPPEDALVFAIATAPASLHPLLATDAVSERINALLYRPLVDFDAHQQPIPGEVDWQKLSDRRYRLRLRPQLQPFSDGKKPTLQDVQATLNAVLSNPASPHAATLSHVSGLSMTGDGALEVRLSRPDPRFVEKLHLGLVPAAALENPKSLARQPLGNGPFGLVRRDAQQNLLLVRHADGQLLRFEVVPDPTMRALKLMRGEAQLLQNDLPYEMYALLAARPDVQLHESLGTTFSYLGFNLEDPLSGDLRVRQAIAHAVDRDAIIEYLFQGHARSANTLLYPGHWAAHPQLPDYAYDPQRARALLSELGYTREDPLHLSYKTSTDPFRLRVAAALQAQLAEVGIELQINSYEWGTFFADIKAGRFQLYSLSWVGIRSPDIFRYVYHSESLPPEGANRGRYRSADADRLIEAADQLPAQQAALLYRQLQAQIHRDLVYVPLWHENNLLLSRGVETPPPRNDGGYQFLEQVSLAHD